MDKIILKAGLRKAIGRKVKLLRKEGVLPANIYGKNIKSESIQISLSDFNDVYKKAGETGLIYLQIEEGKKKEEKPALVANIQKDPVSDLLLHIDFHQVSLKEKVEAKVPVELIGESPAEKQSIGTVVQYLNEIEVEALPTDLPEKFEVDISTLSEVDQMVSVKQLTYDKSKIEVKTEPEEIIVKVEPPQKEEVVAPPAEEVPLEGESVVAEGGAVPAEEATTPQEESKPKE